MIPLKKKKAKPPKKAATPASVDSLNGSEGAVAGDDRPLENGARNHHHIVQGRDMNASTPVVGKPPRPMSGSGDSRDPIGQKSAKPDRNAMEWDESTVAGSDALLALYRGGGSGSSEDRSPPQPAAPGRKRSRSLDPVGGNAASGLAKRRMGSPNSPAAGYANQQPLPKHPAEDDAADPTSALMALSRGTYQHNPGPGPESEETRGGERYPHHPHSHPHPPPPHHHHHHHLHHHPSAASAPYPPPRDYYQQHHSPYSHHHPPRPYYPPHPEEYGSNAGYPGSPSHLP
ncbi:hypothetical protein BC829DRAFT_389726, partial [Chytridium lagenaria]